MWQESELIGLIKRFFLSHESFVRQERTSATGGHEFHPFTAETWCQVEQTVGRVEYYFFQRREPRRLCDDYVCASRKVSAPVSDQLKKTGCTKHTRRFYISYHRRGGYVCCVSVCLFVCRIKPKVMNQKLPNFMGRCDTDQRRTRSIVVRLL